MIPIIFAIIGFLLLHNFFGLIVGFIIGIIIDNR